MASTRFPKGVPPFVGVIRLIVPDDDENKQKVCHMAIFADVGDNADEYNSFTRYFATSDIADFAAKAMKKALDEVDRSSVQARLCEVGNAVAKKALDDTGSKVRFLFPKQIGLHGLGRQVELDTDDMCVRLIHSGKISLVNPLRLLVLGAASMENAKEIGVIIDSKEASITNALEKLNLRLPLDITDEARNDALIAFAGDMSNIAEGRKLFIATVTAFKKFAAKAPSEGKDK